MAHASIDKPVDIDTDSSGTDCDSEQEDPSFDILEETGSRLSNLSLKKKSSSRSRISKKMDQSTEKEEEEEEAEAETEAEAEEEAVSEEVIVPELDEKDKKRFEVVQNIIEVGQVEKLKVDQCKVYLRNHGLRLTGNKDILLQRIREHLSIMNGEGEKKYPASSFVMNCKGDACTGDVVMFEQNVYEMYSIVSRSASGPPCGTRLVVGRIVKESYGAAKQQHTFTIEVLWSKGEKPLPPLHPLLIKGRNLYRLKTMRQRWEDAGERQKILFEKHTRGSLARSSRDARIQEKEMRKTLRGNRALITKDQNKDSEENKRKASKSPLLIHRVPRMQPNMEHVGQTINQKQQTFQQKKLLRPWNESYSVPTEIPEIVYKENIIFDNLSRGLPLLTVDSQRQHFDPSTFAFRRAPLDEHITNIPKSSFGGPTGKQQMNFNPPKSPLRTFYPYQQSTNVNFYTGTQFHGHFPSQPQRQIFREVNNGVVPSYGLQGQGHEQKQFCQYYPQGRCRYGDHCKYLH